MGVNLEMTAMLARRNGRGKRAWLGGTVAALVMLSLPANAQQAGCPPSRTPIKLDFNTVAPPPNFSHRLSLSGIANEARAPADASSRPVGLTTVSTMFAVKGASSIAERGQSACSYLTSVGVTFGWERMQVFIPSEYPEGSCEYRAVIDHENQHVAIIRSTLKEFAPIARTRVEAVIAQSKPVPGRDVNLDRVLAPVKARLTALLQEFNDLHAARSAHIDSPSNYAAVTSLCKNWDGRRK